MPQYKDWITYVLAIISIVVTAWFSYRVLKATEATNKVTEATLELSKQMNRIEEERKQQFEKNMRQLLLPKILKQSNEAYNACVGTDGRSINDQLLEGPKELDIPGEELAKYFPFEEVQAINRAWNSYTDYRDKYFKLSYDTEDDIQNLVEKATPVITDFNNLINLLKK